MVSLDAPLVSRLTLINARGLHARASAKFVDTVSRYDALIKVTSHHDYGEETVIADSIMELLMLGSACGDDITLTISGVEAEPAMAALTDLIQNRFGEGE